MKSVRTTVSLPAEDYAEYERLAEKKVSIAWMVREAIELYLDAESPPFRYAQMRG